MFGIILNIAIFFIFAVGLEVFNSDNDLGLLRFIFLSGWLVCFLFALTLFTAASCMNPGFIESKFDFV